MSRNAYDSECFALCSFYSAKEVGDRVSFCDVANSNGGAVRCGAEMTWLPPPLPPHLATLEAACLFGFFGGNTKCLRGAQLCLLSPPSLRRASRASGTRPRPLRRGECGRPGSWRGGGMRWRRQKQQKPRRPLRATGEMCFFDDVRCSMPRHPLDDTGVISPTR